MGTGESLKVVLAVDPGRSKCGVAVVRRTPGAQPVIDVLHREVVPTPDIAPTLSALAERFSPQVIIIGNGTRASQVARAVENLCAAPVELVDEKFTTLLARKRFFRENPPRGLRRLIPTSLQTPDRPYDDYAAVILAEQYLEGR